MNRVLVLLGLCLAWISGTSWAATAPPNVQARAWVLIDQPSGRILASGNPNVQLAPASLSKLMTAYLLFTDLRNNKLRLDNVQTVPVSALRLEGATMFLSAGEPVKVETLFQGMLVSSATDATLTLIEAVARSESAFVTRMNDEALRMGLTRTKFTNATGLDQPGNVSTARDLAELARLLQQDFPQYQHFFLQKEFSYKGIRFYNTNRLLWLDSSVVGLKTGRTPQSGFCVAAAATRGNQRRIAVVLGANSDARRAQSAQNLLNYGFEFFDGARLYRAGEVVKNVKLFRGARDSVNIGLAQDFYILVGKGAVSRVKAQVLTQQPIVAPIRKGQ
ncbi:MAG: serine hydrolase, partial [Thiobacillus sp.]